EHQDADRHHQGRPIETLKPGNRVHWPILRATVRSVSNWLLRAGSLAQAFMYRRGMVRKMGKMQQVLLTTVGRRSGKPRSVQVGAVPEGDGWVVIASAGGADAHPNWWLNMVANPMVTVQVNDEVIKARMQEITSPAD